MYSPVIIERNLTRIAAQTRLELKRHTLAEVDEWLARLAPLWDGERPTRQLTVEERTFVRNERLLSMLDYEYAATRYHYIIADPVSGGGLRRFVLWQSQRIILSAMATMEEQQVTAHERGEPVDGLLIACPKARQLGATMLARSLNVHRLSTRPHTRAITASVDDDKVQKLYERDKRILDNLPWWLKPSIGFEEKAQHIVFDKLDSSLLYQAFAQKTGLGQGEQFDLGHMTEVASAPYPDTLEHDYFPTIPQSPASLHILESTAQGRGNWWHNFIDDTRHNLTKWRCVFVPWYAEGQKYRRQPPAGWQPSEVALLHAQRVHDTSAEFTGHQVMLSREQLYWWESERAEYQRKGQLNFFLTNWPSNLEESFQHVQSSAFGPELLDQLRSRTSVPDAYEIRRGREAS